MKSHTTPEPRNIIGPQVRKYRAFHKWSQAALAAKCQVAGWDITRDIVATIESRARWIGDFELMLLAKVLAVPVTDLLPDHVNWKELPIARR